jgi:hypothetical protein
MGKKINTNNKTTNNKLVISIVIAIMLLAIIAAIVLIVLPGNKYLINTARYQKWDDVTTGYVETAMGKENTEERFRTYFQWYNVIHEMGHGIIHNNNGIDIQIAEEEQLVNDFAVAYWRYYGEEEKIDLLKDIVDYAVVNVGDNYKNGVDYMELAKENSTYDSFNDSFFNFEDYGWFQFSSVKNALEKDLTLDEALQNMGIKNYKLNNRKSLKYEKINEKESRVVIEDAYHNFLEWGLYYPEPAQIFWSDPNMNSSGTIKNYFYIIDLLDNFIKE